MVPILFLLSLIACLASFACGEVYWGCKALKREVLITYDDGPSSMTSDLLDMLKESQVHATFFVVGANVMKYPETIKRMVAEGHTVGSHTWTHANLTSLVDPHSSNFNVSRFYYEIHETQELLFNLTGQRPRFFRPPYGAINDKVRVYLESLGYTIIMWNSGCIDWYFQDGDTENVIYLAGMADAGAILCLHDGKYPGFVKSSYDLFKLLRSTEPLPYANPQGRNLVDIHKCLH